MVRIRFRADEIFESIGPHKGPMFPAGFVLDELDVGAALGTRHDAAHAASFIDRWVNMGLADRVGEDVPSSDPSTIVVIGGAAIPPLVVDETSVEKIDLTKLSRADLDALAAKRGVDIAEAKNKDDVIAALQLAEELGDHV